MSELASINNVAQQLDKINNAGLALKATFATDTPEGQDMAFAALQASEAVADHLNETINLVHFIGQSITVVDENTGEPRDAVRLVLIDSDGNNYTAVSDQLLNSLSNLCAIYGPPASWDEPRAIQVREQRSNKGRRFFTVVPAPKAERASK